MSPLSRGSDPFALARVLGAAEDVHRDSNEVGRRAVRALKEELSHPGTGRIYPDGHQASAPGEPPAPETFRLMKSVKHRTQRNRDGSQVDLYTNDMVGVYTEFGTNTTEDHQGMYARPWMRPTMKALRMVIGQPWFDGIVKRERAMARRLGGRG